MSTLISSIYTFFKSKFNEYKNTILGVIFITIGLLYFEGTLWFATWWFAVGLIIIGLLLIPRVYNKLDLASDLRPIIIVSVFTMFIFLPLLFYGYLKLEFMLHREDILQLIEYKIDNNKYSEAYDLSEKYLITGDDDLHKLQNKAVEKHHKAVEKRLLSQLEQNEDYYSKRDIYEELHQLNPKNEVYKEKLSYYKGEVREIEAKKAARRAEREVRRQAQRDAQREQRSIERKIEDQFDVWGQNRHLVRHVRRNMHDPGSFEHVETKYLHRPNADFFVVTMKYRGKNAFGAKVLNTVMATLNLDGEILYIERIN